MQYSPARVSNNKSCPDKKAAEDSKPKVEWTKSEKFKNDLKNAGMQARVIELHEFLILDIEIGKGGFGTVKKEIFGKSDVAVKLIPLEEDNKYILREIVALDQARHANIVNFMAVSADDVNAYIITEYFNRYTLQDLLYSEEIQNERRLTLDDKVQILNKLCSAVTFLHNRGLVHKDIKSSNILVNAWNDIKLIDLGLSRSGKMPDTWDTTEGRYCHGTPTYMSYEILIENKKPSEKCDVWALAVVIIEVMSGKNPWQLEYSYEYRRKLEKKMVAGEIPDFGGVPEQLHYYLQQCFNKVPCLRPSASELLLVMKCLESQLSTKN